MSARQRFIGYKNGRNNVQDENKSGRPSLVIEDSLLKINKKSS